MTKPKKLPMRVRDWLGFAAMIAAIIGLLVAQVLWGDHTVGVHVCIGKGC